jgi:hypothetical protein
LSQSEHCYVAVENEKMAMVKGEMIIAAMDHSSSWCVNECDENVFEDVRNYMKAIARYLESLDQVPLFVEMADRVPNKDLSMMGGGPHMLLRVFPVPKDMLEEAGHIWREALREAESEFDITHKAIYECTQRGVKGKVAHNFPYVWAQFGTEKGVAHPIEDRDCFSNKFIKETMCGALDIDMLMAKGYRSVDDFREECDMIREGFKDFDWMKNEED